MQSVLAAPINLFERRSPQKLHPFVPDFDNENGSEGEKCGRRHLADFDEEVWDVCFQVLCCDELRNDDVEGSSRCEDRVPRRAGRVPNIHEIGLVLGVVL